MDNQEVRIVNFVFNNENRKCSFDEMIEMFHKGNFHFYGSMPGVDDLLDKILTPLQMSEKDMDDIKDALRIKLHEEENYLKNNREFNREYKDRLYSFLLHLGFQNTEKTKRMPILKMLNVPQFFINTVIKDFNK